MDQRNRYGLGCHIRSALKRSALKRNTLERSALERSALELRCWEAERRHGRHGGQGGRVIFCHSVFAGVFYKSSFRNAGL